MFFSCALWVCWSWSEMVDESNNWYCNINLFFCGLNPNFSSISRDNRPLSNNFDSFFTLSDLLNDAIFWWWIYMIPLCIRRISKVAYLYLSSFGFLQTVSKIQIIILSSRSLLDKWHKCMYLHMITQCGGVHEDITTWCLLQHHATLFFMQGSSSTNRSVSVFN